MTLAELVENQKFTGEKDINVIKNYFIINDCEELGINLISELAASKIEKTRKEHEMIKTWGTIIPSKYLYSNYDIDTADKLHMMELDFLINAGTLSHDFLEWAKENIPNIPMPKCYFVPLIEWLKTNNIKFKETL